MHVDHHDRRTTSSQAPHASPPRAVHFLGSIKTDNQRADPAAAMQAALDSIEGLPLRTLPDGETGAREWWIRRDIDRQQDNTHLQLVKTGDYSSYQQIPEYQVRDGHQLTAASLGLTYAAHADQAWPVLSRLREQYHRPALALQVGIPSPVDMAVFSLGYATGGRHIAPFAEAVSGEINTMVQRFGDDVVVQLDTPAALSLALLGDEHLPTDLHLGEIAAWMSAVVTDAPPGTRFGVHLCLGDMGNETHHGQPLTDGEAVSRLVAELLDAWPTGAGPEYIHFPVAGGKQPPLLTRSIYRGLRGLRDVPSSTRIIAGVAHEAGMLHIPERTLREQRQALNMIDDSVGRRVDVAAPCGVARGRTVQASRLVMRRMAELAHDA